MSNFKRLRVWAASRRLVGDVYRRTACFPRGEVFGLTGQIRRCATSICANIAEGCGRGSDRELRRYLYIARGSAHELESHLTIACDLGMLSPGDRKELDEQLQVINRMLHRLAAKQDD